VTHLPSTFFSPASIAVLGATPRRSSPVNLLLRNLLARGYSGTVHPVTDRHQAVEGLPCSPSPAALPEPAELAVVGLPAPLVLDGCRSLAAAGTRNMVVVSAGFAEAGPEGAARQRALADLAHREDLTIIGPNCMGFLNLLDGVAATFASAATPEAVLDPGPVAVLSQSGGIGAAVMVSCQRAGIGASFVVNTGNEAVVGIADVLRFVVADGRSRAAFLYVEQFARGADLLAAVTEAQSAGVSTVVLHGGRERAGSRAAASHTGAMTSDGRMVRELLVAAGAWVVESLVEATEALGVSGVAPARRPRGPRVTVVGTSGGMGVLGADAAASAGLTVATPSDGAVVELRSATGDRALPTNPMDVTPDLHNRPEDLAAAVRILAASDQTDAILLHGAFPYDISQRFARVVAEALAGSGKPVAAGWVAADTELSATFRQAGIACFDDITAACRYLRGSAAEPARGPTSPGIEADRVPDPETGGVVVTEDVLKAALDADLEGLGVRVPRGVVYGAGPDDAELAAAGLVFPVAVKAVDAAFPHKAAAGVLALGCAAADARDTYARIEARMRAAGARHPRILLEEMVEPGVELFVGGRRDPGFGLVGLVGLGGTDVERDRAVRFVSLDAATATAPIMEALGGLGTRLPDAALERAVTAVAALLEWWRRRPDLVEFEINPLIVNDRGVWVADALAVRGEPVQRSAAVADPPLLTESIR
jgi:acyl-CoA synthetase (NDP forming)